MHLSRSKHITSCVLAALCVLAHLRHDVVAEEIQPNHAKTAAKAEFFARGGFIMTAEHAYEMFNKWVMHLRGYKTPIVSSGSPTRTLPPSAFPANLDFNSLGYGLYFRRPGLMLVKIKQVMDGVYRSNKESLMKGHYVTYKQKDHYKPLQSEKSPIIYEPYVLKDVVPVVQFPNTSLGVIRVNIAEYKDTFKPANGDPPYERYQDYPGDEFMPDITKLTDQREYCWVVIHNYFNGDAMGYNQYQWRYWPVRKVSCNGLNCIMKPVHNKPLKYPKIGNEDWYPGRICVNNQDGGAPVMCHPQNVSLLEFGQPNRFTTSDKRWKLGYWIDTAQVEKNRRYECNEDFIAVDLAAIRDKLYDPELKTKKLEVVS